MSTFEAHGHTWTSHMPGDPMPCDGETKVIILWRYEALGASCQTRHVKASRWEWGHKIGKEDEEIIGWCYATPQPQEPDEATVPEFRCPECGSATLDTDHGWWRSVPACKWGKDGTGDADENQASPHLTT